MRYLLFSLLVPLFLCFAFSGKENGSRVVHPMAIKEPAVAFGEKLEFKLTYGIFTVGKAQMKVYNSPYRINSRDCFRVDVKGKTSGAVDWVAKVDDTWGAYIDTADLKPHMTYRRIREGKYRKDEVVKFDHNTRMIEVKVMDKKTGEFKEPDYFQSPTDRIFDMIGGYIYLRSIDFSKLRAGDIIRMDAFFEDTVYDFQVRYLGTEPVKTKMGWTDAIKLQPIMPDNKIFNGKNSITAWFSADKSHIPLLVEANMFIGTAGVELTGYDNLKQEIKWREEKDS